MNILAVAVMLFSLSAHSPADKQDRADLSQNNGAHDTATSSFYSYNQTPCPNQKKTSDEPPAWWKRPEWWLFGLGVPSLFFVGWQAKTTSDSVKTANKGLVLQFRPKITIRGGYVENADRSEEAAMEFAIVNTGTSVAHLLESKLVAKLVDFYYPSESLFVQSFDIPAAKVKAGEGMLHTFALDKQTTAAIRAVDFAHRNRTGEMTTKTILFVGTLCYTDEFKTLRRTGVFRRYDPSKKRFLTCEDPDYDYAD